MNHNLNNFNDFIEILLASGFSIGGGNDEGIYAIVDYDWLIIMPFWETKIPGAIGIALCAIAVIGIAATLVSFGNSFRVGIDEQKPDKLVTTGMFAFSRNPIYVCFDTFFIGQFLIHRNIIIAVAIVGFALAIHRQVLREEKFLSSHYGAEYEEYRKKARQYL